jgi:hypothetical protein
MDLKIAAETLPPQRDRAEASDIHLAGWSGPVPPLVAPIRWIVIAFRG